MFLREHSPREIRAESSANSEVMNLKDRINAAAAGVGQIMLQESALKGAALRRIRTHHCEWIVRI